MSCRKYIEWNFIAKTKVVRIWYKHVKGQILKVKKKNKIFSTKFLVIVILKSPLCDKVLSKKERIAIIIKFDRK